MIFKRDENTLFTILIDPTNLAIFSSITVASESSLFAYILPIDAKC